MRLVDVTFEAGAPADKLWMVLADFPGFLNWAGGGQGEIRVEGDGIGMIRHLSMTVGEIAEKLVKLDDEEMLIGYELVNGEPIGMKVYRALVQVVKLSDDTSQVKWHGEFEAVDSTAEDQVAATLEATFQGMTQALVAYVGREQ